MWSHLFKVAIFLVLMLNSHALAVEVDQSDVESTPSIERTKTRQCKTQADCVHFCPRGTKRELCTRFGWCYCDNTRSMKTWKNHFNIVHDMLFGTNTSGFGWDTIKCCITADAEVWDEYLKSHKSAACFRDKPFPQYDNLCKIFGKDRATGNGATDLGDDDGIEETQRNSPIDIEGIEDVVQETQPSASVNSKRKRGQTNERNKIDERSKTDDVRGSTLGCTHLPSFIPVYRYCLHCLLA
ncbi:hypothetical protein LXL04_021566 [Taraxacum kok-saghyz]